MAALVLMYKKAIVPSVIKSAPSLSFWQPPNPQETEPTPKKATTFVRIAINAIAS
jgi:hypothetical protein